MNASDDYALGRIRHLRVSSPLLIVLVVFSLCGLFFVFSILRFYGDSGDVIAWGVVVDRRGSPISGASVTLKCTSQSDDSEGPARTITDAEGRFMVSIDYPPNVRKPGFFELEVNKAGFSFARVKVAKIATDLRIRLEPVADSPLKRKVNGSTF